MANMNRPSVQARDAKVISGIQKHLSNVSVIPLAGKQFSPGDLSKVFQGQIDSANAVVATRAAWKGAVQSDRATATVVTQLLQALRAYVVNQFGEDPQILADFGFTPRKKAKPSPETQVSAVAKRDATRKARHTMGKKQKKDIKGTVPPATGSQEPATAVHTTNGVAPAAHS